MLTQSRTSPQITLTPLLTSQKVINSLIVDEKWLLLFADNDCVSCLKLWPVLEELDGNKSKIGYVNMYLEC